jgi:thiamine biosynthesis lipoprotein
MSAAASAFAARPLQRHARQGVLLGAETEIQLYHHDSRTARVAIDSCFAEVKRLEAIFSLQRPDSALSRLNRAGRLDAAPAELVELLRIAAAFSRATDGAFDVTVQPLWRLYAGHFSSGGADTSGPSRAQTQRALDCVDYRLVEVRDSRIAFQRPGMAVTLNGIAQGFITDRVTRMLRAGGFEHVLVNMGEMRALQGHPDGTAWRIGIADPERPWRSLLTLPLRDRAIATSGGYGTRFDPTGRHHHLFDPRTGESTHHYRSVSVLAPDATTADALSTGLCALPLAAVRAAVAACPEASAIFISAEGAIWTAGVALAQS